MASDLFVSVSTENIAIELVDAGSDFADLINEVAAATSESGFLLSEQELRFFSRGLSEGGRTLLKQLSCAIAGQDPVLVAAKEVMNLLQEHGPSIVPHLLDDDQNAGQRLRAAIAQADGT